MLFIILFAAAAYAPPDGKTMATDDWRAARIVAVGGSSPTSPATYIVIEAGDLDGDGVEDDSYVKLACVDGNVREAWYQVKGPRDAASGMASGKRTHKPVTFVKEWGPSTPQLSAVKPTYDIKTIKSARKAGMGEWSPISLANTDGLCAAAGEAALKVTKTRSNIQNN